MKNIILLFVAIIMLLSGCEKYLDVNENPNGVEKVSPFLYLSPMESQLALSMQYDARLMGFYTQNWAFYSTPPATMPYDADLQGSPAWTADVAQHWRTVYWSMGQNLTDMINISTAQERWDLVGIGYALRAWGWQMLTDFHGPVILKEAFEPGRSKFDYDNEKLVYDTVVALCNRAISFLNRSDGAVSQTYAAKGDLVYSGNRLLWKKFAFGILAINMSHLSNKSALYDANKVITYVDSSFTSNSDNFLVPFNATVSDDANFLGPKRNNIPGYRTSKFAVSMMDGTVFGVADPRISIMLPPSANIVNKVAGSTYVGVEPGVGYTSIPVGDQPFNFYGLSGVGVPAAGTIGMYMFKDNSKWPLLTYPELQFIKAEAAFRLGDKAKALEAYSNGVSTAIDFTNSYAGSTSFGTTSAVTPDDKLNFLKAVVPVNNNDLTMSKILCQKYVHMWSWGTLETWSDMRRFHYTDTYNGETTQVFAGYVLPAFPEENNGKPVYRVRPRYNSDYVWNAEALEKIGALETDYHTKEIWFSIPE